MNLLHFLSVSVVNPISMNFLILSEINVVIRQKVCLQNQTKTNRTHTVDELLYPSPSTYHWDTHNHLKDRHQRLSKMFQKDLWLVQLKEVCPFRSLIHKFHRNLRWEILFFPNYHFTSSINFWLKFDLSELLFLLFRYDSFLFKSIIS